MLATLRAAWRQDRTRLGFWAHFGLMTPFVTMTALWGYPWLVEAQGIARGTAATWLASRSSRWRSPRRSSAASAPAARTCRCAWRS